ncbi:hypothetical protein RO1_06750 [Roseburia intestinalis XB6B4]|uniref:Uncharacterized protein n=1 Tax=Roseburia intestinalis XB6B4 TaxID=718255 RepID=D4KVL6_9FIRM|nr:hypothetical protein RO1_06750 [Roseburia intestinalis XB6B4]
MGKEEFFDEQIIDMMNKAEQKKKVLRLISQKQWKNAIYILVSGFLENGYILNVVFWQKIQLP